MVIAVGGGVAVAQLVDLESEGGVRAAMTAILIMLGTASCDSCRQATGSCCKTCTASKACGDSCIPRNQSCSKFGGCACNGLVEELTEMAEEP